ncbi:hypothetical protein MLD38_012429 [Melastoma candidum]|uniref:Uncharacterized protein n=1 Tax=Melastoma candidum TaxID=119954 RepID=A0ACB9R9X4_9MYRT|nr:hypothetical protein MLD38_012429 [Melastoma candidum]
MLSACDELVKHGVSVGESPAAVVLKCKHTIAMLSDMEAALSKDTRLALALGDHNAISMPVAAAAVEA